MTDRRIRAAGAKLIEEMLVKAAFEPIAAPTLAALKAKKTRELGTSTTANAVVPKVVSSP